jgi:CBS domain-containing protein
MAGSSPALLHPRLTLAAATAEELMTSNPVSIRGDATIQELIVLLTDKGIAAAPVIDEAGHPVGVVSRADVLAHDRESISPTSFVPEYYSEPAVAESQRAPGKAATRVSDLMTPVIFSVRPDTPAGQVVEEMLAMNVHRLFVIDDTGVLIGVISSFEILKHLRAELF